jgi:hypothetical protein
VKELGELRQTRSLVFRATEFSEAVLLGSYVSAVTLKEGVWLSNAVMLFSLSSTLGLVYYLHKLDKRIKELEGDDKR